MSNSTIKNNQFNYDIIMDTELVQDFLNDIEQSRKDLASCDDLFYKAMMTFNNARGFNFVLSADNSIDMQEPENKIIKCRESLDSLIKYICDDIDLVNTANYGMGDATSVISDGVIYSTASVSACIYGPPPTNAEVIEPVLDMKVSETQICIYGPPSAFSQNVDVIEPVIDMEIDNPQICIYGPPSAFGQNVDVIDPVIDMEIDNPQICIYGPPSVPDSNPKSLENNTYVDGDPISLPKLGNDNPKVIKVTINDNLPINQKTIIQQQQAQSNYVSQQAVQQVPTNNNPSTNVTNNSLPNVSLENIYNDVSNNPSINVSSSKKESIISDLDTDLSTFSNSNANSDRPDLSKSSSIDSPKNESAGNAAQKTITKKDIKISNAALIGVGAAGIVGATALGIGAINKDKNDEEENTTYINNYTIYSNDDKNKEESLW